MKNIKQYTLLFSLLFSAMIGCGNSDDTAKILINIGQSKNCRNVTGSAPSNLTNATLTVKGKDFTYKQDINNLQNEILVTVPANKKFTLSIDINADPFLNKSNFNATTCYNGTVTIPSLSAGENYTATPEMKPSAGLIMFDNQNKIISYSNIEGENLKSYNYLKNINTAESYMIGENSHINKISLSLSGEIYCNVSLNMLIENEYQYINNIIKIKSISEDIETNNYTLNFEELFSEISNGFSIINFVPDSSGNNLYMLLQSETNGYYICTYNTLTHTTTNFLDLKNDTVAKDFSSFTNIQVDSANNIYILCPSYMMNNPTVVLKYDILGKFISKLQLPSTYPIPQPVESMLVVNNQIYFFTPTTINFPFVTYNPSVINLDKFDTIGSASLTVSATLDNLSIIQKNNNIKALLNPNSFIPTLGNNLYIMDGFFMYDPEIQSEFYLNRIMSISPDLQIWDVLISADFNFNTGT